MTTVIYDGRGDERVLMADSLVTGGVPIGASKLHKVRGAIIGICGNLESGLRFVDWFRDQRKAKPDILDDDDNEFEAIVVAPSEVQWWGNGFRPIPITEDYYAIGSGAEYAIGAMDAGATAGQALAIAKRRDKNTGGETLVMTTRKTTKRSK